MAARPCIWLQAHLLGVEHSVCALAMPYALAVGAPDARLSLGATPVVLVVSST